MAARKGMMVGRGKGYYNYKPMLAHDRKVHHDAGLGRKQPQRMPQMMGGGKFAASSKSVPNIKIEQIGGDVNWETYGGKFLVDKKFNNGEFDYYLVINFINMEEARGEEQENKYVVEIHAVAPSELSKEQIESAFESAGIDEKTKKRLMKNPKDMVEVLDDYGTFALMDSDSGNDAKKLMTEAKKQIPVIEGMFGFYMDKRMNAIGNTGWDFIKGDIGFKG